MLLKIIPSVENRPARYCAPSTEHNAGQNALSQSSHHCTLSDPCYVDCLSCALIPQEVSQPTALRTTATVCVRQTARLLKARRLESNMKPADNNKTSQHSQYIILLHKTFHTL
jgi:hypothetical protein